MGFNETVFRKLVFGFAKRMRCRQLLLSSVLFCSLAALFVFPFGRGQQK